MSTYSLVVIGNVLAGWANAIMMIAVILVTFWLSGRIVYRLGVDGLELWQRWQALKLDNEQRELAIAAARLEMHKARLMLTSGKDKAE